MAKYRRSEAKAYAREHVKGLWIGAPTPFTSEFEVDEAAVRSNMRYYIDRVGPMGGIFTPTVIGEFWSLTIAERMRILEIQVEEARGEVPIMAHVSSSSAHEVIQMSRHAEEVGADYLCIIQPYVGVGRKGDEQYTYHFYKYIADRVNLGIAVFNSELVAGYSMSPELMGELAKIEHVVMIKDPETLAHIDATRRAAGANAITCDCQEDNWLVQHSQNGQPAMVANYTPYMFQTSTWRPIVEYTELADRGDLEGARRVSETLAPVRQLFNRWMGPVMATGAFPAAEFKVWCETLGMKMGPVRPPLLPMAEDRKAALVQDLIKVGLVKQPVGTR